MDARSRHWHDDALALMQAHCRSLDPRAPSARQRLEASLGPELAAKLLFALVPVRPRERRAA
jgi:hypothetical protein